MPSQAWVLEQLDIVIGIVLILVVTSIFVTAITQAVSAFLGLRGVNLRWGVSTLLRELDPTRTLDSKKAFQLASSALTHPLVSDSTVLGGFLGVPFGRLSKLSERWQLATAIRSDELLDVMRRRLADPALDENLRELFADLFTQGDAVALVRDAAQAAGAHPNQLPPTLVAAIAAQIQPGIGLAAERIRTFKTWFDSSMDRVSQRFATHTRVITVIAAFLVAFILHIDVLGFYARIATNSELRAAFMQEAVNMPSSKELANRTADISVDAQEEKHKTAEDEYGRAIVQWQKSAAMIGPLGLLPNYLLPPFPWEKNVGFGTFKSVMARNWKEFCDRSRTSNLGILLGGMLLSFGAPFWFNMLKTLISLRPILAKRIDERPHTAR